LGYCYFAVRDYEAALEEVAIAERGRPGSFLRAMILKRQGKWEEALASLEQALALSPREPLLLENLGYTYESLRRYEEAEIHFDRALALRPDAVETALSRALVPVFGRGDTRPLRTFLEGVPPGVDPWGLVTFLHWYVECLDREYAASLEVLSRGGFDYIEFEGPGGAGSGSSAPRTLLMGLSYAGMGEAQLARAAADSARRDLETRLRERPDDPRLHVSLSQAHALLDQREEAVRAAQRAMELVPMSEDAQNGPFYVLNLANIHAWSGEVAAAVELIDRYLSVPAPRSIESILRDPVIDPIRDDPRFQALVAKYK
jgi:serine/threonine-protein kinase